MHYFWIALFGLIASLWVLQSLRLLAGMAKLPRLEAAPLLSDSHCPAVSLLVAARDEARELPRSLPSHLAQDYPTYEVIVVDDRSSDASPRILDEFARVSPRLKIIHVEQLPKGWLGKPHALWRAYQQATGEWLVFTDADVRLHPQLLRRSLALAAQEQWDHLTALPLLETVGFWEKTLVSYFVLGFVLAFEPWKASDPHSTRYLGIGAFQLVRRSAYEALGTHRRLALEVADDTKLGKLVKQSGLRSGVAYGEGLIRLRWQAGLINLVRGLTKNFFAACQYSIFGVASKVVRVFVFSLLPFMALIFSSGAPRLLASLSVSAALVAHAWATSRLSISPLFALTHPLGALVTFYVAIRSTLITLWRGGVVWRETYYSLDELRRGMV